MLNRRAFGLLSGTSLAAIAVGVDEPARAAANPSLLQTTLMPMGGTRAGNADGSIPAWTGGYTTLPAGFQAGDVIPEPFADEQPILVINSANVDQYAARLPPGIAYLIKTLNMPIKIFATHRTAAAPQSVYDNIAANVTRAVPNPQGARLGFSGAFGGVPFPIPNWSDPLEAGAEIVNNHNCRWQGYGIQSNGYAYTCIASSLNLAGAYSVRWDYVYYAKQMTPEIAAGMFGKERFLFKGPPVLTGQEYVVWQYSGKPQTAWELLNGQGRVRLAPELAFDTPDSQVGGLTNYDEAFSFNGSLEDYDWKYIGTKEMYVPYNCNKFINGDPRTTQLAKYVNPDLLRWELHRVHVVDATLHPGKRNVIARRTCYADEDTFTLLHIDEYDAAGNLYKINSNYIYVRPDLPGNIYGCGTVWNLQVNGYAVLGIMNEGARPSVKFVGQDDLDPSYWNAQNMAASAQY